MLNASSTGLERQNISKDMKLSIGCNLYSLAWGIYLSVVLNLFLNSYPQVITYT